MQTTFFLFSAFVYTHDVYVFFSGSSTNIKLFHTNYNVLTKYTSLVYVNAQVNVHYTFNKINLKMTVV